MADVYCPSGVPMIDGIYDTFGDPSSPLGAALERYHARHGTESACILTVYNDEKAALIAEHLRPRIEGKIVVEIGAGIGLLGCHMAGIARKVYCIEVDPAWTSCFVIALYAAKPPNLTFIFGRADDAPPIAADVALFCTHSGQEALYRAASRFAPEVIDVYEEIIPGAVARERLKIMEEFNGISTTSDEHQSGDSK